ncbi:hypothetical protein DL93DRAFT_2070394 [Clavulina sp. PMI_390]|nr:hypothetical protein DL93DRAFT_2070394 [Clavulina sp. PMI_390]
MKTTILAIVAALMGVAGAVPLYGQCGGAEFPGPTTCDDGLACVVHNPWYFQCLPYADGETTAPPDFTTTVGYSYYRQ